jgi:hypothetical protein
MPAFPQTTPYKWRFAPAANMRLDCELPGLIAAGPIFEPILSTSDAGRGIRSLVVRAPGASLYDFNAYHCQAFKEVQQQDLQGEAVPT